MSLIDMTMKHGQSLDEARAAWEEAVRDLQVRFGRMIRRANWDGDRNRVRVEGVGFWVEMVLDAQEVHASGDVPILGGLLGSPIGTGIKQVMKKSFEKALPGRTNFDLKKRFSSQNGRFQSEPMTPQLDPSRDESWNR